MDSVRILEMPGWPQNVVDIDTYGSPWKHWNALLPNAPDAVTVFLTIGLARGTFSQANPAVLAALGVRFATLKLPPPLAMKLSDLGVAACIAQARAHGFEIVECQEADNAGGTARYIGVRLERKICVD